MRQYDPLDNTKLRALFKDFVDAGLHGKFNEALDLIDEPYVGVGMGEQGIVKSKAQAELVLRGGYRPSIKDKIQCNILNLTVNYISHDVAVLMGEVEIVNQPENQAPRRSGLMQTVGARRTADGWGIAFTHASPTVLTIESVDAYPIRFMDHTISLLKAGLQAETVLYAEINLTQNTVIRMERHSQEWPEQPEGCTLEDLVGCGLYGQTESAVEQEYNVFFNRLRLLGLFAEGVSSDHFDYRMSTDQGPVWLRASVEMLRHSYSGDAMAVLSFSSLDSQKLKLEQFTHRAFHDALTGILNRDGFENRAAELLRSYDPQCSTALFMIDLDDFKQINDRLGHQMGDTVLHQVAGVLQHTFSDNDAVGRVGGDEFMVLLTGRFSSDFLKKKADELLNAMTLRMGGSKQIPVSVSIGIAFGRARSSFEKFYRIADIALYTAKKAGKCRYHLINADTNVEQSYSAKGSNLLSLQTLLDFTEGNQTVQSRTPYEAVAENIPGSVLVFSLSDQVRVIHCNDWTTRYTGYSSEEIELLQKEDLPALAHPDDRALIETMIDQMYAGTQSVHVIYRMRRKDGTYGHVQIDASMTERTKDEIIFYGIETDVEEAIQLKQEVVNTHNRLQALISAIPGGIAVFEITDTVKVTQYGSWFWRYTGYSSEEESEHVRQGKQLSTVWPEDVPITQEALRQVCEEGVDRVFISVRLKCKDATPKWTDIRGSVIERTTDKVTLYVIYTEPADRVRENT